MYHTQENRNIVLNKPIICYRDDAWLGEGYYFWNDEIDAKQWGKNSKKATGSYQVYKADIDTEDFLDTVFNEEHYLFWLNQIERIATQYKLKVGVVPTIKELNEWLVEKHAWDDVDGIIFQDIPTNQNLSKVRSFFYRKRIQAVVFDVGKVSNFVLLLEDAC